MWRSVMIGQTFGKVQQLVRFAAMLLWMDIFGSSCRCHWDWSMFSELGLHNFLDRLITFFHHEMLTFVYKKAPFGPDFSWHHLCFLSSVCYQDSAGFQCTCWGPVSLVMWQVSSVWVMWQHHWWHVWMPSLPFLMENNCQLSHQLSTF